MSYISIYNYWNNYKLIMTQSLLSTHSLTGFVDNDDRLPWDGLLSPGSITSVVIVLSDHHHLTLVWQSQLSLGSLTTLQFVLITFLFISRTNGLVVENTAKYGWPGLNWQLRQWWCTGIMLTTAGHQISCDTQYCCSGGLPRQ